LATFPDVRTVLACKLLAFRQDAQFCHEHSKQKLLTIRMDRHLVQPVAKLSLLERRLVESHTTASSSLACSTVPNSPVSSKKLPKPSTRSPGLSSSSVAEDSESGGFLARSVSDVAPGYDRAVWGHIHCFLPKGQSCALRCDWVLKLIEFHKARL
jgi:hypothetical protein